MYSLHFCIQDIIIHVDELQPLLYVTIHAVVFPKFKYSQHYIAFLCIETLLTENKCYYIVFDQHGTETIVVLPHKQNKGGFPLISLFKPFKKLLPHNE